MNIHNLLEDWGTIKVGDLIWEDVQGGSIQIRVLTKPTLKGDQWTFEGDSQIGKVMFLKTIGSEHYGPRLVKKPGYSPLRYLKDQIATPLL